MPDSTNDEQLREQVTRMIIENKNEYDGEDVDFDGVIRDTIALIHQHTEQAKREAYVDANSIVMRKRDVYLRDRDVTDNSWLQIRDQLRSEISTDIDSRISHLTTNHKGGDQK